MFLLAEFHQKLIEKTIQQHRIIKFNDEINIPNTFEEFRMMFDEKYQLSTLTSEQLFRKILKICLPITNKNLYCKIKNCIDTNNNFQCHRDRENIDIFRVEKNMYMWIQGLEKLLSFPIPSEKKKWINQSIINHYHLYNQVVSVRKELEIYLLSINVSMKNFMPSSKKGYDFEKNVMLWLKEKISILPESNKYKIWTNINVYKLGENEQVRNNKNNLFYNQKNISDPKGEIDIMIVYVNKDFIIPLLVIECKTSMAGVYHDIRRMNTMIEMLSSLPKIRNIKTPWGDKQLIDTIQWNNVRYIIEENISSIDINHPYFLNMALRISDKEDYFQNYYLYYFERNEINYKNQLNLIKNRLDFFTSSIPYVKMYYINLCKYYFLFKNKPIYSICAQL